MLQRLRDWWTLQSKSAHSPEYDAAMERRMPGFLSIQAGFAADTKRRRQQEAAWWNSVVAMQAAGRIADAVKHAEDHMAELGQFVLEPMERLSMLYALEVDRLLALGDRTGAELAAREAVRWLSIWASHSTSGGEGAARSSEMARVDAELQRKLAAASTPG